MTSLEIREAGQGPAVVLLHGSPTSVDVLDDVAIHLSKSAKVMSVSLPGYGKSPPLPRPWRLPDLHHLIEEALHERRVERAAFVGFSGGAYHAIALACRGAIRPWGVVCLAGLLGLSASERDGFRQLAAALDGGVDLREFASTRFLSSGARTGHNVAAVQAWLDSTSRPNLADEMRAFADAPDLTGPVGTLDVSILARVGSDDVACPPPKSEAIVAAARRGILQVVAGAGHALPLEDPSGTIQSVAEALGCSWP